MGNTILGANTLSTGGYTIANSVRFNDGDSPYLKDNEGNAAPAGNRQKFTFSIWFKRCKLGVTQMLASAAYSSGDEGYLYISGGDVLVWHHSSSGMGQMITTQKFRDVSAWYHLVWAVDTTQGTASNRMKFYINGTQITSFSTETYPDEDKQIYWNVGGTYYPYIGRRHGGDYWDGYIAEVAQVDDAQLAATSFGEFDEDSPTHWKPIDLSDLTFGTSGYWLDFEDSSELGKDVSGVGNHFADDGGLAATDQCTDTPTNNFATLNSLYKSGVTFAEGNTQADNQSSDWTSALPTMGVANGKWYAEFKVTDDASGTTRNAFGVCDATDGTILAENELGYQPTGAVGDSVGYPGDAANTVHKNGSNVSPTTSTYTINDIISVALDCDNGAVYFAKNGTWQNSGDPTSGASKTGAITVTTGKTYFIGGTVYDSTYQVNYGNPTFAISSGNADGNGYGNFEYSVPSGYYALCSKNLAEYG